MTGSRESERLNQSARDPSAARSPESRHKAHTSEGLPPAQLGAKLVQPLDAPSVLRLQLAAGNTRVSNLLLGGQDSGAPVHDAIRNTRSPLCDDAHTKMCAREGEGVLTAQRDPEGAVPEPAAPTPTPAQNPARQDFLNKASECLTIIERAYTRLGTFLEVASAAYGNAYDMHLKTLATQHASNELPREILLQVSLALVPGAIGGITGRLMDKSKLGLTAAEAAMATTSAGLAAKVAAKGAASAVPGAIATQTQIAIRGTPAPLTPGAEMQPLGEDPRTWRAKSAASVNAQKEISLDKLRAWQKEANDNPDFEPAIDPRLEIAKALKVEGTNTPLQDIPIPDQVTLGNQLELGMWQEWLKRYGHVVRVTDTRFGSHYHTEENQGKEIRNRIDAIGGNGNDYLERYGGVSRASAEAEASRNNRGPGTRDSGFYKE